MAKGIPVVISDNGYGIPVTPVESGAPSMIVSENGLGTPIVITGNGAPFVVDASAPQPPLWQSFFIIAGNNPFGWGYAIPPLVSAPLGEIIGEPYEGSQLISFFEAPDDSRVIVCFSGDVVSQLSGHTFNINGTVLGVLTPPEYDTDNDWTMMHLESYWMIEGQAYIVHRVEE